MGRPLVSVHCYGCYGTGMIRQRDMMGFVKIITCHRCKGVGKLLVEEKSGQYYLSKKANIGATGLWPGLRKGHSKYFHGKRGFKKK